MVSKVREWNVTVKRSRRSSRVFEVAKVVEWKSEKVDWWNVDCFGRFCPCELDPKCKVRSCRVREWKPGLSDSLRGRDSYPKAEKVLIVHDEGPIFGIYGVIQFRASASTSKGSSEPKLKEAYVGSKEHLLVAVGKVVLTAGKCTDKGIIVTFHAVKCTRILHPTL
ncbi:hypothetical protein V6N12_042331 [Hibiscus sabdariffa]|uniref:Uncharacterized protein n=1 Tax=Hibiscus sabdariffa TaxID=183260 RepID=A0ABR2EEG7_9ROSI